MLCRTSGLLFRYAQLGLCRPNRAGVGRHRITSSKLCQVLPMSLPDLTSDSVCAMLQGHGQACYCCGVASGDSSCDPVGGRLQGPGRAAQACLQVSRVPGHPQSNQREARRGRSMGVGGAESELLLLVIRWYTGRVMPGRRLAAMAPPPDAEARDERECDRCGQSDVDNYVRVHGTLRSSRAAW